MSQVSPLAPSSLDSLPNNIRNGMITLGACGLVSLLSTISFFLIFSYRMIYWRRFSSHPIIRNQVFLLVYNLFIADIIQASGFVISFWWISQNKLIGPSSECDFQGLLVQIGDVASGLWSLAIAVHTFVNLVAKKSVSYPTFLTLVLSLWIFIFILAIIGPVKIPGDFFVPMDAWCWVGPQHDAERFYLHYLWIFISELGCVLLYTFTFIYLRFHINANTPHIILSHSSPSRNNPAATTQQLSSTSKPTPDPFAVSRTYILKSSRYMVVYILAYLSLSLPLAAGRAANMAGIEPSKGFFIGAATLMACSGFVNVVLYISTRRLLLTSKVTKESVDCENKNRSYSSMSGKNATRLCMKEELP